MKNKKILFLTLHTFGLTGGIEQVGKTFAKTLCDLKTQEEIQSYTVLSMYDEGPDLSYVAETAFKGYGGKRVAFSLAAVKHGLQADIVILSHIHLLLYASLIKKIKSKVRIVLFAHGIEIWNDLPRWKKQMLGKTEIWAVSRFTATQIAQKHKINESQIKILNNCLDPYFKLPELAPKPTTLLKKYSLTEDQKLLLTICRISSAEQYKGYDSVIACLAEAVQVYPNLVYLLVGKGDAVELARINKLISKFNLSKNITLTGFVPDEELALHYQLADVFVMPSKAEGFGLVFIEAAAFGCPVIGGNTDGSRDALLDGELGTLVNPDCPEEISSAILNALKQNKEHAAKRRQKCFEHFGYPAYPEKVLQLLNHSPIL